MIETVLNLAAAYGWIVAILLGWTLIIVKLVRILLDESESDIWRGRFYKSLYRVSGRRDAEKKYIASDVNGRLNKARKQLHCGTAILPRAVRVEWIDQGEPRAYSIEEGEYVVCLDPGEIQERNIVTLATILTRRTTLTGVRHVTEPQLKEAIDLNVVKNLLRQLGNREVLDWFFEQEYRPAVDADDRVAHWNHRVVEIDEKGLLTRLLLVELEEFARRIYGLEPRPYMWGEIEGLIEFLYNIAAKQHGIDVRLEYLRGVIRIGVILVGKGDKILQQGIDPYVKAFHLHLKGECEAIYTLIFDKYLLRDRDQDRYQEFLEAVAEMDQTILDEAAVHKDFELSYRYSDASGQSRKATCVRYIPEGIRLATSA